MLQKLILQAKPEVILAAKMASKKEGLSIDEWACNVLLIAARKSLRNGKRVIKEPQPKYKYLNKK